MVVGTHYVAPVVEGCLWAGGAGHTVKVEEVAGAGMLVCWLDGRGSVGREGEEEVGGLLDVFVVGEALLAFLGHEPEPLVLQRQPQVLDLLTHLHFHVVQPHEVGAAILD